MTTVNLNRRVTALGDKGEPLANTSTWESDGKLVVTNYPADQVRNEYIWLTGRGDHPTLGRGEGARIKISYGPGQTGDRFVDIQFNEQVQLHDGRMFVPDKDKWTDNDEWSYSIVMPATSGASTPGTGNSNKVDTGQGYSIFVPAAGDGAWTIDFNTVAPVPAGGAGYWHYDYFTNVLEPSSPGQGGYHLLDIPMEVFFMKRLPIPIHAMAVFDMQPYKSERISPRWALRFTVHRASTGDATILGWVQIFRQYNTTL